MNKRKRREKERGKRLKKLLGCLEGPSLLTLQAERRRLKKSCGKRKKNSKRNWQKKSKQGRIEMTVVPARRDTEREAGTEQEREVQVGRDATAAEGTAAERGRAQITMTTTMEVGGAIGGGALCTKMNRTVVGVVVGGGVPYTKVMQMAVGVVVGDGVL